MSPFAFFALVVPLGQYRGGDVLSDFLRYGAIIGLVGAVLMFFAWIRSGRDSELEESEEL